MNDQDRSQEQLLAELAELRQRLAAQDAQLARSRQAEPDPRQGNSSPTQETGRGISARTPAEAKDSEDQMKFRLAVEASGVGLWDWDLHTNEVHFSPEWKRQIGYGDEEIPDRFEEWQSRVHPEDLDYVLRKIQVYLANPHEPHEVEFRFRHKDGSYRHIFTRAAATLGADGRPARFLGCHIDITERKRAEEALQATKERLTNCVGGCRVRFV